jgi:hypothetical protein
MKKRRVQVDAQKISTTEDFYWHFQNDGLVDIFIGLILTFAGLFLYVGMFWMVGACIPIFLPVYQSVRKRMQTFTIGPMVSVSEKENDPKPRMSLYLFWTFMLLIGCLIFLLVGWISGSLNIWLRQNMMIILGLFFGSTWMFCAFILRSKQFFIYAVLTFGALSLVQFEHISLWQALIIIGLPVLVMGLSVLIHYLPSISTQR